MYPSADNPLPFKSRREQQLEREHGMSVDALLRRLYVDEGLSQQQIARRLGVSRGAVVAWMARWGIPTRDRRALAEQVA